MKLFLLSGLAFFATPIANALTPVELYEKVKPSVGIVFVFENDRFVGSGSAVVIGKGKLVTNRHVVEDATRLGLRINDKKYRAEVAECAAGEVDLCIINAPDLTAPSVPFASSNAVKIGDKVFAVGAPNEIGNFLATLEGTGQRTELTISLSDGLISALRKGDDGTIIQTTAPISPGSSGGGLFNEEGELIGITTFKAVGGENINMALPTSWILKIPGAKSIRSGNVKLSIYSIMGAILTITIVFGFRKRIASLLGDTFSSGSDKKLKDMAITADISQDKPTTWKDQQVFDICMEKARAEMESGLIDQNKWDITLIEAKGNEALAKALYIKSRAYMLLPIEKELAWRRAAVAASAVRVTATQSNPAYTSAPPTPARPKPNGAKNLYDVLGIAQGASDEQILAGYQTQKSILDARENQDAETRNRLIFLQHAKEVLLDPAKRAAYDARI